MFKHLKENNISYLEHLRFACKIGLTLIFRGYVFLIHGFFPFANIPEKWNLEKTSEDLENWNEESENR